MERDGALHLRKASSCVRRNSRSSDILVLDFSKSRAKKGASTEFAKMAHKRRSLALLEELAK